MNTNQNNNSPEAEKQEFEQYLTNTAHLWQSVIPPQVASAIAQTETELLMEEMAIESLATQVARERAQQLAKDGFTLDEAAKRVEAILRENMPERQENIAIENIRQLCNVKMSSADFEKKIVKPLKRDLEKVRFKLELQGLLAVSDPIDYALQRSQLAGRYQISNAVLDALLAQMKHRNSTPEVITHNLDDFLNQESEGLQWLIPELLPKGEVVLCVALPKVGKSLLAIDAAFAVATGESEFLGQKCQQGKVLLVSVDESANSTKSKLQKRGFLHRDAKNVRVMSKFNITQIAALEAELEDFRPDLVVIDSLKRITHGGQISENSAEFSDIIYTLKEALNRYNASGILIHHSTKNPDAMGVGKARGSTAIVGACWGMWEIDRIPRKDPNNKKKLVIDPRDPMRVFNAHSRDSEGLSLSLEFNPENNSWISHGELGVDAEMQIERETYRETILRILGKNQHLEGLSGKEIIECMGMTREEGRSVYSELSRMVSKRLIDCKPASNDKRYNVYSLPVITQLIPGTSIRITPPLPSKNESIADYYPKTHTEQGLQIVSNHSADSQQVNAAECSNPLPVSNTEIVSNSNTNVGGGVVDYSECDTEQTDELAMAFISMLKVAEDCERVKALNKTIKAAGGEALYNRIWFTELACKPRYKAIYDRLMAMM